MSVVEELLVRIIGDNADLKAALGDSEKDINAFAAKAEGAWKSLTHGAIVAGAAVVAIGGYGIKAASDFEDAFSGVLQSVNDTEENISKLKQSLRDMGKDAGSGAFGAVALAAVAKAGGELGMTAPQVATFTKTVADFAKATKKPLDEAEKSLSDYVRAAQVAPDAIRPLTSVTIALVNALGGKDEALLDIATKIDAVTTAAGISKPKTLAFAAALGAIGVDAGRGGAAFNALVTNISKAVSGGGKELQAFAQVAGMSARDFAALYKKDAAGALTAFIQGLHGVKASGGDTLETLGKLGLADGVVGATLLKAAEGADKFTQGIATANREIGDNVALTNGAAIGNDNAKTRNEALKKSINDMGISIGSALLPAWTAFLGIIQPVVDWLGKHEKITIGIVAVVGTLAFAIIAASTALKIYEVYTGLAAAATALFGAAEAEAAVATEGATIAQWALNVAMDANPIGLIILALVALAAAIAFVIIKWDDIKNGMRIVGEFIVGSVVKAWNFLATFFSKVWDDIAGSFKGAIDWFLGIGKAIIDGILNGLKGGWHAVTDWFGNAWKSIKNGVLDFFGIHSPSKLFEGFGQNMTAGLVKGLDGMDDAVRGPIQEARDAAQVSMTASANIIGSAASGNAGAGATTPPIAQVAPTPSGGSRTVTVIFQDGAIQVPVQSPGADFNPRSVADAVRVALAEALRSAQA